MAAQVSSGSISIGPHYSGAASRSINYIIGEGVTTIDTPSTVQRSLNDPRSRLLAQKTSAGSPISFSDFYSKRPPNVSTYTVGDIRESGDLQDGQGGTFFRCTYQDGWGYETSVAKGTQGIDQNLSATLSVDASPGSSFVLSFLVYDDSGSLYGSSTTDKLYAEMSSGGTFPGGDQNNTLVVYNHMPGFHDPTISTLTSPGASRSAICTVTGGGSGDIYQFNIACSNTGGGVNGGLFYGTIGSSLTLEWETPDGGSGYTYTCTLNFT